MSSPITGVTQDDRLLAITTPLGPDVLLLASLSGREAISSPYAFDVTLLSTRDQDVPFAKIVGHPVTIAVMQSDGKPRYVHGLVQAFAQTGGDVQFHTYQARVVPSVWFLSQRVNSRVFQKKSVTDIIEQVLRDAGVSNYKLQCSASYEQLEYCVQYEESDLDFISRLMESAGIFYFFEHAKSQHTMVIADQRSAHQTVPGQERVRFEQMSGGTAPDDVVTSFSLRQEFRVGKYTVTDYNFETPSVNLLASEETTVSVAGNGSTEKFEYPGGYGQWSDGSAMARVRMQAEEATHLEGTGAGTCRAFTTGYRFSLAETYERAADGDYVLVEIRHTATAGSYVPGASSGDARYENEFVCIPFSVPYRPTRRTPKPVVQGLQPAVVVGKSGEEIWVDKYGRIKVQFFWDRLGKKDENSSCWVRVAQPWAGKNWGAVALPRMGQEVMVAFLEGDPDRPLVVGSVYNAEQMPPYALPDNQTQSGVKSRSSKGGGADNFNELRFEDKKGSEEIHLQAEKDLTALIKNDETRQVQHDRTTTIKNNETRTVSEGKDATTVSKGDQTIEVSQGKQTVTLGQGDQQIDIKMGNQKLTLDQGDQTVELKMGNQSVTLKMGNQTTKLDLGSASTEAMQKIELKVGQNSIVIDQMGITIKGMQIKIDGQIQTEVHGLMTTVKGDAMVTVKGGITMIN